MKRCYNCKLSKDESEFTKDRSRTDGLKPLCRACCKLVGGDGLTNNQRAGKKVGADGLTTSQRKGADGLTNNQRDSRRVGADGLTKSQRHYQKHPDKKQAYSLQRNYQITLEEFNRMSVEQKGACAICKKPGKRLCVDHDHKTGAIRALLCHRCNLALAFFEVPEFPLAVFEYLTRYASKKDSP